MSKLYILLNTTLYTKLRVKLVSNNAKKGKITVKQLLQIIFERVAKHIQVTESSVPTHLFGIYASSKDEGVQLLEDSDDPISYTENIFSDAKLILKLRSSVDDVLSYCIQDDVKLSPLFLKLLFLEIHTLFLSSADTLDTTYNKETLTQIYALILQSLLGDYRPYLYSGMSKSHFVPQRTAPVAEQDLVKEWSALQGKSSLEAMGDFLIKWNPDFVSVIPKEDPQQRLFLEISSKLDEFATTETLKQLQQWLDNKMNKSTNNIVSVNKITENPFVNEFSYKLFFQAQNEENNFKTLLNMLLDTIHSSDNTSYISNELKSGDFTVYFSNQLERSDLSAETKQLLIKCLVAFASIDNSVYSILGKNGALNWVILGLTQSMKEESIVLYYLYILADICLNTKQFPKSEQRKLDGDLVEYLVDIAMSQFENSDETLFSAAITCILYMNLHFTSWRENPVVQTFLTKSESQNFGNYLIQILNRAEPHLLPATLKFLQDMFSHSESSDWFFLNDFRVLKEIIIRELQGLPQHDEKLLDYLELLYLVLKNHPNEEEKQHRIDEISAIVNAFLSLEVYPATDPVYNLAEKIYINILS